MISCVMPTADRGPFVRQALRAFAAQTYPDRELIVVDDGESSVASLCRDTPGVRYIRLRDYTTTGAKLNIGIEAARGEVIQRFDDDDYYGPEFLATQLAHRKKRALVTRCCFLVLLKGAGKLRFSGHGWQPGGAFCFHRSMWKRHPFRDQRQSEDTAFIADHHPPLTRVCGHAEQYIVARHGANTWNHVNTELADDYLRRLSPHPKPLEELVPALQARFYRSALRFKA